MGKADLRGFTSRTPGSATWRSGCCRRSTFLRFRAESARSGSGGAGRHRAGARVRAGRAGPHPDHPGPLTNKGLLPMDQRTVSSVIAWPVAGARGGRIPSTNPARRDEVVADVALGDAALLVTAARAARAARSGRGRTCPRPPVRGRRSRTSACGWRTTSRPWPLGVTREIGGKPYPEALGEVFDGSAWHGSPRFREPTSA